MFKNVSDRSAAENYHSVSLLSVISKIFKKIVNDRLVDHSNNHGSFSDFQYHFNSLGKLVII